MGQKVNPIGFRLGVNKTWNSRWFAERNYSELLHEDIRVRRKGTEIEKIKKDLEKIMTGEVIINILEVRKPETDAQLVAENIALQLVRRVSFRRAMKRGVTTALKFGVKGIRVACAGRLGGAEMARREWYREGRVPLHTLRADIDYGFAEARTTYGIIGVKVLIFNGEVLPEKRESQSQV